MALKYGCETNQISNEVQDRAWSKAIPEFVAMLIVLIVLIGGLVYASLTKSVAISEKIGVGADEFELVSTHNINTEWNAMKIVSNATNGRITVMLPAAVRADNITVENYYQERSILIKIKGAKASSFENTAIAGDTEKVLLAAYRESQGYLCISILFDGVYDFVISQDAMQLVMAPYKATSRYEHIVAIVPETDVYDEFDLTAAVANKIAEIYSSEDIRVYTTRSRGSERSDEDLIAFLNDCGADTVIFVGVEASEDTAKYGMSAEYYSKYYLPELSNATIAEALLRNAAISANNRANEVKDEDIDSRLHLLTIPAARINIGYISNEKEYTLLQSEDYQENIARGIITAINEVRQ